MVDYGPSRSRDSEHAYTVFSDDKHIAVGHMMNRKSLVGIKGRSYGFKIGISTFMESERLCHAGTLVRPTNTSSCLDKTRKLCVKNKPDKVPYANNLTALAIFDSGFHTTFLESETKEQLLYVFKTDGTEPSNFVCTIQQVTSDIYKELFYCTGSQLFIMSDNLLLHANTSKVKVDLLCIKDSGSTHTKMVTIHVLPDTAPVMTAIESPILVSVLGSQVGEMVSQVNASDKETPTGKLRFYPEGECYCPFTLKDDGRILIAEDLRSQTESKFQIPASLSDGFHRVGIGPIAIELIHINHAPHFVDLPRVIHLQEHSSGCFFSFSAEDVDNVPTPKTTGQNAGLNHIRRHQTVRLTWAWGSHEAVQLFEVNELNFTVCTKANIDYEVLYYNNATSFNILLVVSDGYLQSREESIRIEIIDINEPPVFLDKKLNVSCLEGRVETVILEHEIRQTVADPDKDEQLEFNILEGPYSTFFDIDTTTGYVSYALDYDVDHEKQPGYVALEIEVKDKGRLSDTMTIYLNISNVNKPPTVHAPSSVRVPEDTPSDSVLFVVDSTDDDFGDNVTISVTCLVGCCHLVDVLEKEGQTEVRLKANVSLDYEHNHSCQFSARAFDGQMTSISHYVTVYITDVNEPPSVVSSNAHVKVPEGLVGELLPVNISNFFHDPDGDTLTYSLQDGHPSIGVQQRTGDLVLLRDVMLNSRDANLETNIIVCAIDLGGLSVYLNVSIEFYAVNQPPVIIGLPAHITVFEKPKVNEIVHSINVSDDGPEPVSLWYRVITTHEDLLNIITINTTSGHVILTRYPDIGQGMAIDCSLVITAFDGLLVSKSVILNITIVGVNDPPEFPISIWNMTVNETELMSLIPIPQSVLAFDKDPDDSMIYTIHNISLNNFRLIVTGNNIVFPPAFDTDAIHTPNSLTFTLLVTDNHGLSASSSATITITDVNDNAPVVDSDGETVFLSMFTPLGSKVTHVRARDVDTGSNAMLTYKLECEGENYSQGLFVITTDGWIILAGMLDDDVYMFRVCVAVSDMAQVPKVTEATVNIIITNSSTWSSESTKKEPKHANISDVTEELTDQPMALVVISVLVCLIAVVMVLAFKLCQARSVTRRLSQLAQEPRHDYRFDWVPETVNNDDTHRPQREAGPTFPPLLVNQNYEFDSGVTCSALQEGEERTHCDLSGTGMFSVDVGYARRERRDDSRVEPKTNLRVVTSGFSDTACCSQTTSENTVSQFGYRDRKQHNRPMSHCKSLDSSIDGMVFEEVNLRGSVASTESAENAFMGRYEQKTAF